MSRDSVGGGQNLRVSPNPMASKNARVLTLEQATEFAVAAGSFTIVKSLET